MWSRDWRDAVWARLGEPWDLVVVGGGITGAGILREAVRAGLRALLVEQRDFAWGTSSRSSKLVHGGLRYLKQGRIGLTRDSVRERERLLQEGPGLVEPLGFLLPTREGERPGRLTFAAGLTVYDLLALQWSHQHYEADDFRMLAPHLAPANLAGGFRYGDALTDDARLVLRVLREAVGAGALALNYVEVTELLRVGGEVAGVRLRDREGARHADVRARAVVNATGAWADRLRAAVGAESRIRPLRGGHLTVPAWRLRIAQAMTFLHPRDHRPVLVIPWEGVTLVGTTDVDHDHPLDAEPAISAAEARYLLEGLDAAYPSLGLGARDVVASFAGVRPVIGTGKADPSQESRDHAVWDEHGLLTVTGGKLTTFRLMAHDALAAARRLLPDLRPARRQARVLDRVSPELPAAAAGLTEDARRRLIGRYGADAARLAAAAGPGELQTIPGTPVLWGELRWAAREEGVRHLDDLLLRRVRLGLLVAEGGRELLPRVRELCQRELGWADARWDAEVEAYLDTWKRCYGPP